MDIKKIYTTLLLLMGIWTLSAQSDPGCFSLRTESVQAETGEEICVSVTATDFRNILGLQFALQWDPAKLEFKNFADFNLPGLSEHNFGLFATEGSAMFSWFPNQLSVVDRPDGATLFSLCFEVLAPVGASASVRIDDQLLPVEITRQPDGQSAQLLPNYLLVNGSVQVGSSASAPLFISEACNRLGSCEQGQGGSIDIGMTGGLPAYTFAWTGPAGFTASTPNISALPSGVYKLSVHDSEGYRVEALAVITPATPRISDFRILPASCAAAADGAIDISVEDGSGNYTFQWSNGAITEDIEGVKAGTYSVTVSDEGNCQVSQSFELDTITKLGFSQVLTPASCGLPTGSIDLIPPDSSAEAGYIYQWSNGQNTQNIAGLSPGNHQVTITDTATSCQAQLSFSIEAIALEVTTAVGNCEDPSTRELTAAISSGGEAPYTFRWSTGEEQIRERQSTVSVPNLPSYSLTVTDQNGCETILSEIENPCFAPQPRPLGLYLESKTVSLAKPVCIDLRVMDFDYIEGLQFSIGWDARQFRFEELSTSGLPGFGENDYAITRQSDMQVLSLSWFDDSGSDRGITLPDHQSLLTLCLQPVGGAGTFPLIFTATPTPFEAFNEKRETLNGNLTDGSITLLEDFAEGIQLIAGETQVQPGEEVCVDITVTDFRAVSSLQHTLRWDPALLRFERVDSFALGPDTLLLSNFGLTQDNKQGILRFLWSEYYQPAGRTLADGERLYQVCFTALDTSGISPLAFADEPLPPEGHSATLDELGILTRDGAIAIGDDFVWPGDTDVDQVVTHYDLLNIGLAFGQEGPARANASLDWRFQTAADWPGSTPQSRVNHKHMDTDGNGRIERADTSALRRNWGRTVGKEEFLPLPIPRDEDGVPLYIQPHSAAPGAHTGFDIILGDENRTAENIYGLSFSIRYDTAAVAPGSAAVLLTDSWLGSADNDLLTIQQDNHQEGRLDVALTRLDGLSRSGRGAIGQLLVTIEDVILIRSEENYEMPFQIEGVKMISAEEEIIPVNTPQTMVSVALSTSLDNPELGEQLRLFPVPARDHVALLSEQLEIRRIECHDATGRLVGRYGPGNELYVGNWPAGVYVLRIVTNRGLVRKTLIVNP